MKNDLQLIIKGFLIGIAKVIPGVSGSLLAMSLGVYEKSIDAISHFFQNIKENIFFLGKLGTGILISVVLCSRLISYFLSNYSLPTIFLFIGLISGGIPNLLSQFSFQKPKNKGMILILFILFILFSNIGLENEYIFKDTIFDYFYVFFLGFVDAVTMIIPGISGTLVFLLLGSYSFLLNLFGDIFHQFLLNPMLISMLGCGLLSGIYLTSRGMNCLFHRHTELAYTIIFSFMISSLYFLIRQNLRSITDCFSFLLASIWSVVGYFIARKMES